MNHQQRIKQALLSLEGLSLGDSFGQSFFIEQSKAIQLINGRVLPKKPWLYTDDTLMAISIVETLNKYESIEIDTLVRAFARRYIEQPNRGYGSTAAKILREISEGVPWKQALTNAFSGMGSMGNGGAMRAAPHKSIFLRRLRKSYPRSKSLL